MQIDSKAPTILDLFQVLVRHRRPMMWTFSCIMLITIAATVLSQKTYMSEAKLFVRLGRESVSLDPTATTGQVVMVNETRENEINSIFELLKSRTILSNVVAKVGEQVVLRNGAPKKEQEEVQMAGIFSMLSLSPTYSLEDVAVRRLAEGLKIAAVKKSNVINISYEAGSPELARDIVASVIEQAREMHGRVNRIQGSHEFFTAQTKETSERLEKLEQQLVDEKNRSGVSSVDDQRLLQLQQMSELETTLLANEAGLAAAQAEMQACQIALKKLPETVTASETIGMPHSTVAAMREQLFALQMREKETLVNYSEIHPHSILIREQVAALRKVLDTEPVQPQVEQRTNAVHQEVHLSCLKAEASAASLQAQGAKLQEQLGQSRRELTKLNNSAVAIARLELEIQLETASYEKYSENLEQARIDHELEMKNISNLNILQPPTCLMTPTKPRRTLNLALGMMAALASSLGVGLLLEQRHSGVLSRLLWKSEPSHTDSHASNGAQQAV